MAVNRRTGKLAVILHADVAGSTDLVRQDEQLAHERIQDTFRRFGDTITKYHGHVRELRGDALLAEFERASDAVTASLAFQADQSEFLVQLDDPIQPNVRVGIAMGEVIIADDTITGEGVVLAQRLEQLAEPGRVVIQGAANETIPGRFPFEYENLGEHEVKGFDEPVRVYRANLKGGTDLPQPTPTVYRTRNTIIALTSVAVVVAGVALMWFKPWEVREEPASVERMAFSLPNKPSIAVLPFANLSGKEEQEYFSDGITNDIITDLSKFKDLFVIASNSTFTYKGKPVKVQQVAEDLGVRYVLEGSVQATDEKIRINAQLIDATTGRHLWAERYDRAAGDMFAIQNEIIETIVSTLAFKVEAAERGRILRKETESLDAYDSYLRAIEHFDRFTKEEQEKAGELFKKAIEIDPTYATAFSRLAWVHANAYSFGWSEEPETSLNRAFELAKKAAALAPDDHWGHWILGYIYLMQREFDLSEAAYERAYTLNPNDAEFLSNMATTLLYLSRPQEAIEEIKRAMRLNPHHPESLIADLGWAYYEAGQYKESVNTFRSMTTPRPWVHRTLAAAYVQLGQLEEARSEIAQMLEKEPNYNLENTTVWPYKDPTQLARYIEDLRKAGVPEHPPLKLPDKPSIAVLAFDNLSGDPGQDYLSDGITESLITRLARQPDMFVIARNSSFTYKGKPVKVQQVGREMGVRYVLEGSVQKSGDRIRITAQLIEAATEQHLWTDSYDRELEDLFAVQDEITQKVATELAVKLTVGDTARLDVQATDNVEAYDHWLRGVEAYRQFKKESNIQAGEWFEKAIELDPQYARAIGWLGWVRLNESRFWWVEDREASLQQAEELARQAISIDENSTIGHNLLSRLYSHKGLHEEAIAEGRRTIAIEPSHASAYASLAYTMFLAGKPEEGQDPIKTALRLSPYAPLWFINIETNINYLTARYEEAVTSSRKFLARSQEGVLARDTWRLLISSYFELGRESEARAEAKKYLELDHNFSVKEEAEWRKGFVYKNKSWIDHYIETLRKSGLPE